MGQEPLQILRSGIPQKFITRAQRVYALCVAQRGTEATILGSQEILGALILISKVSDKCGNIITRLTGTYVVSTPFPYPLWVPIVTRLGAGQR